jgi:hypothetical protein
MSSTNATSSTSPPMFSTSAASSTSAAFGLPPTLAHLLSGAAAPTSNPASLFSSSTIGTLAAGATFSSMPGTASFFNQQAIVASSASGTQAVADAPLPAPYHFARLLTVKLSPDNYLDWRAQLLPLLRSHYLEGFIDGTLLCPPQFLTQTVAAGGAPVSVLKPAHRIWVAQDQAIRSSLTEGVAGMVLFAATSHDAWDELEGSFASQSTARSMAIRQQLQDMKKRDLSASVFFNKIKSLADTLTSIGHPLSDEEFTS